jgi:hypothetical protein
MTMNPCEIEIVRLHEFFVDWFTASVPTDDFQRVSSALASDFHMISPRGAIDAQKDLLSNLLKAYGCHKDGLQFRIDIRNCQCLHTTGVGTSLWKYEEWQTTGESVTARISTVLFRESQEGYNGLEWAHVHETWMPGKGPS